MFYINDAAPLVEVANIQWYFNDIEITDESVLVGTTLTFSYSESVASLTLGGITQDAVGRYTLYARNPAGIASNYTDLSVQGECVRVVRGYRTTMTA